MANLVNWWVGNYKLHEKGNFNFQLNRLFHQGADLNELKKMAAEITDMKSYVDHMLVAYEKAVKEENWSLATAYMRGAEFFSSGETKAKYYHRYLECWHTAYDADVARYNVKKVLIPYESGYLPCMYREVENPKGTIVIHGGFDSYLEEFLKFMIYVSEKGFNAYIFEGPGQGACIYEYGMPFTEHWEKPVGAVLDYFKLDDVMLVGISLGSVLCKLAAAKEKRVQYVAAIGTMTDALKVFLAIYPDEVKKKIISDIKNGNVDVLNHLFEKTMQQSDLAEWSLTHAMHVMNQPTPADAIIAMSKMNIEPIADQVDQDYILVASQHDHFMPVSFVLDEVKTMTNTRSFTCRIITEHEQGDDHCNVSNRKLMLDIITDWFENTRAYKRDTIEGIRRTQERNR